MRGFAGDNASSGAASGLFSAGDNLSVDCVLLANSVRVDWVHPADQVFPVISAVVLAVHRYIRSADSEARHQTKKRSRSNCSTMDQRRYSRLIQFDD